MSDAFGVVLAIFGFLFGWEFRDIKEHGFRKKAD